MTIDEKYDIRVNICRTLRILEDEIEKITNVRNKYNDSNGNKKVTLSIYVEGEAVQYELSEKVADSCLGNIINNYTMQKEDIIQTLKQEFNGGYSMDKWQVLGCAIVFIISVILTPFCSD